MFDCCRVHSLTGRSHLDDEPLEPTVLYDLLYSYHGEACIVAVFVKYMQKFVVKFGLYSCDSESEYVCVVSVGGDDHHCGVHSGRVCFPNELQPQEQGTSREPRG